jgi:hypothetical protein
METEESVTKTSLSQFHVIEVPSCQSMEHSWSSTEQQHQRQTVQQQHQAGSWENEEAMDVQTNVGDMQLAYNEDMQNNVTTRSLSQMSISFSPREQLDTSSTDPVTRSMAQRVQQKTAEVSQIFQKGKQVEELKRDAGALVLSCLHSALAMIKDGGIASERKTHRVEILQELLITTAVHCGW